MPSKRSKLEGAEGLAPQDSRDTTKAGLLEAQFPVAIGTPLDHSASTAGPSRYALPIMRVANAPLDGRWGTTSLKGTNGPSTSRSTRQPCANAGSPTGRESYGDGAPVVVAGVTPGHGGRESRPQGEGAAPEKEPELVLWHVRAGQVLLRPGRGGTRDAECQDGPGDHSRPRQARTAAGAGLSTAVQPRPVPARVRQDRPQPRGAHAGRDTGNRRWDDPGENRCHDRSPALRTASLDASAPDVHREEALDQEEAPARHPILVR